MADKTPAGKFSTRKPFPKTEAIESIGRGLLDFVPFYGAAESANQGNYGSAAAQGLLDLFGGTAVKVGAAGAKKVAMLAPALMGAIKASHGSPHKFSRFSMDKIGTGEGAQAYGDGLYFAEGYDSPVAKGYAVQRGVPDVESIAHAEGLAMPSSDARIEVLRQSKASKDSMSAAKSLQYASRELRDLPQEKLAKVIESVREKQTPSFYNVDLRWPDAAREAADPLGPQHFLHWDKPLSEQPESVRSVLKRRIVDVQPTDGFDMGGNSVLRDNRERQFKPESSAPWVLYSSDANGSVAFDLAQRDVDYMFGKKDASDLTGQQIISRIAQDRGGQAAAREYLGGLGIPGIRYLDGNSRSAGEGTYNYVVFDDQIPAIRTINGLLAE